MSARARSSEFINHMTHLHRLVVTCAAAATLFLPSVRAHGAAEGFRDLFNGKDLDGWAGRHEHWSIRDGAITGVTTKEVPAKGNNFLIAQRDGTNLLVRDFELRLSYRIFANNQKNFGNSGVQYRSKAFPTYIVRGYQADFEYGTTYSGILYEEGGRGVLAQRGQKVVIRDDP